MDKLSVEERVGKARSYFKDGYNCSQSVAMAFSDVVGLDAEKVAALMSGFGGGMGRMREVCGAVSGMTFAASALSPAANPSDKAARTANYALVQELAGKFKEENGSIICRELLGLRAGQKESPVPSDRTSTYYHARPCERMVESAARILAEKLGED